MAKRKSVLTFLNRVFHSRKIIVVSDHAVDYYPLSRVAQSVGVLGLLAFVSWISYSTGSYVEAQTKIQEKDRTIAKVNLENRKISNEFSLLKRDLVRMKEEDGDLSEYAQFVIKQYSSNDLPGLTDIGKKVDSANHVMVFERISFLENRVNELKAKNNEFVDQVRGITAKKIDELEKVISLTGLNRESLERKLPGAGDAKMAQQLVADNEPQGGPYIPLSTEDADPTQREALDDVNHLMQLYALLELLPVGQPLGSYRITSPFGGRTDPVNGHAARHEGMDLASPGDPRIHATADGEVSFTGWKGAYGNTVDVEHGLGVVTRYGHLSRILVQNGQKVKKGDVIAVEGSTGRSTGTHLHYEVRFNDRPLNPANFLKAGIHVSQK